jgi:hypothetical protein
MLSAVTVHAEDPEPASGRAKVARGSNVATVNPKRIAAHAKVCRWVRMGVERCGAARAAEAVGFTRQHLERLMSETRARGTSLTVADLTLLPREVSRPILILALAEVDAAVPRGVAVPLLERLLGMTRANNELLGTWAAGGTGPDTTTPAAALVMLTALDRLTDEISRLRAQLAPLASEASKSR